MRLGVKALAVVALIILIPTGARAQAVIAGSVRDTSGAVLPGVTVEASSPALIEKVRTRRQRQHRPVPHRGSAARDLHGHVLAAGFSTFEREGVELTGSFTATINAEMKVGSLAGDGHRHRREPDRRRPERAAPDRDEQRRAQGHSDRAQLQRARRRRARRRDQHERRRHRHGDDAVPDSWRPQQRGPHDGRRAQRRQPAGRQSAAWVTRSMSATREEISFTTSGGLGESETAGLVMNIVPKTGGNTLHGSAFYSGSGKNLQADNTAGTGLAAADAADEGLRRQRRGRRTDHEGSRLVFRDRADAGQHAREREPVLQPECRRCDEVALRAGSEQAGILRPHVGEHQRAPDVAGDAAQQDRRLLGRAVGVPEVRGQYDRHHDSAGRLARGERPEPDAAASRAAGDVDIAGDQPAAARRRLRRHVLRVGQLRTQPEPDARSDQGHRTVRGRLRSPTATVRASSIARRTRATTAPGRTSGRRTSLVRHRRAQLQGRLSAHADDRRPDLVDEQHRISGIASTTASRIS